MPYGDDLYKPENIVAYTGDINNNPSVYFMMEHENGDVSYGHITQDHDNLFNIGKEPVRRSDSYELTNKMVYNKKTKKEELRSFEYDLKIKKHTHIHKSRNPNIKVDAKDNKTRTKLASALDFFKEVKPKYAQVYMNNKIAQYQNDNNYAEKLDDLEKSFRQMAEQSIENKPENDQKYLGYESNLKQIIQKEKIQAAKRNKKNDAKNDLNNSNKKPEIVKSNVNPLNKEDNSSKNLEKVNDNNLDANKNELANPGND